VSARTTGDHTYQEVVEPQIKFFELFGVELLQNCTLDSEDLFMAIFKVLKQSHSFCYDFDTK
jgi:hypothetical protein